jgi:predicted ATP-binding protein involved in virulence
MKDFKIDTIHLENYKKYKELNLSFHSQFTLIIGENGSGKTSILDAIATILGGYLQAFKEILPKERHSILKKDINLDIIDKDENITTKYNTPVITKGAFSINNDFIPIERIRQ